MWFLRLVITPAITLITFIWAASFTSPAAAQVLAKMRIFGIGLLTMVLSTDKRFKKPETDPDVIKGVSDAATKRVIFIRHGESDWNEVFNRGFGPSFFVRLLKAVFREVGELSITPDSVFIDSALSPLGMVQARELVQFLEKDSSTTDHPDLHALLKGDSATADSVIFSSNLRRALATAAIGLQQRLQRTGEKCHIASCLQEISFNLDAGALAPALGIPDLHAIAPEMWSTYDPQELFDPSLNTGDKPIFGTGLQRMNAFCELVFGR
jgi:broad specificity phosphatase PhoE